MCESVRVSVGVMYSEEEMLPVWAYDLCELLVVVVVTCLCVYVCTQAARYKEVMSAVSDARHAHKYTHTHKHTSGGSALYSSPCLSYCMYVCVCVYAGWCHVHIRHCCGVYRGPCAGYQ